MEIRLSPNLAHASRARPPLTDALDWAISAFVLLGVAMRLLRYLLHFPLWGDEAALAANFLDRGYADLLRPLDYQQVAPPLFLWIELWIVQILGFSEWSLRAFPLVCSVASLWLFRHVARRLLGFTACHDASQWIQLFAVAVFSVSYYPLRHGVEVKQYASDLLVSLALIGLALEWLANQDRSRCCWFLIAAVPVALGISHPATFVAGGLSVALFPVICVRRSIRDWIWFVAYNWVLLGSFAVIYFVSTGPQIHAAADEGIMRSYWANAFPPLDQPVELLRWCFVVHAGQLFAYPVGGTEVGSGLVPLVCFVAGAAFLFRSGRRVALAACLAPFAVTFAAAALQRYPYGGYARTAQHLAPMVCLLAGAGLAWLIALVRRDRVRQSLRVVVLGIVAAFGCGLMVHDILRPFRTEHDRRVCEFARWFWSDKAIDAELVCAFSDLNQPFFKQTYPWRGIAQYLCNQRIYSLRSHGPSTAVRWDQISENHPLRCVIFSRPGLSRDEAAFDAWMEAMEARFDWIGYERNDFHKPHEHGPDIERIELYEFVPRATVTRTRNVPLSRGIRSMEQLSN